MLETLPEERSMVGRRVLADRCHPPRMCFGRSSLPPDKTDTSLPIKQSLICACSDEWGTLNRLHSTPIRISGLRNEQSIGAKRCKTKIIETQPHA